MDVHLNLQSTRQTIAVRLKKIFKLEDVMMATHLQPTVDQT